MIQDEKTMEKFGYYGSSLTPGSNKLLVLICDYCGKDFDKSMKIRTIAHKDIATDCCKKCKHKKIEAINLMRYGVKSQFERKEIMDKLIPASIERLKTQDFKDKRSKTCIEKYGTDNMQLVPEIIERTKATNLEKFGVEYSSQSEEVKDKVRNTNTEKYGSKCYLSSDIGRKACKESMMVNFGVENPFQAEEIKEKIKAINMAKYGYDHYLKVPKHGDEHGKRILQIKKDTGKLKTYNGKTVSELRESSGYSDSRFRYLIHSYGYDEACKMTPKISSLEQIMASWVSGMGLEFNKNKLGKCYPDFNIEDKKLILEPCGVIWHSDRYQPNDDYHVEKLEYYKSLGYRSLFFWEDEVVEKPEIIKSIIKNKAGLITEKIAARKCEIKEVSTQDGVRFVQDNHLMGPGPSSLTYFLMYDGYPVSCLQMKRKKGSDYEVSRFCSKLNVSVMGAFSKLLSHFEKTVEHTSILTFIDKRYGEGLYLADLGFVFESCYKSFCWTNGHKRIHRMRFPGNTGYEMGYNKLWDCGQAKYIKTP